MSVSGQDEIFVVGGGPSIKNLDLNALKNKDVVAVNKSIFDVPESKYFITIDYTFLRKIDSNKFKKMKATKFFVANFFVEYLKYIDGRIVDTRNNFKKKNGIGLMYHLPDFDIIIKSKQSSGMGLVFNDFRSGGNSGFCGLQLAVMLGYKKIYLLGMDMNDSESETHYHGGYGEPAERFYAKAQNYLENFISGINELSIKKPEVQVFSCSPVSKLNQYITYKNFKDVV